MSSDLKKINKVKKNSRRISNTQEPKLVERLIKISRVSKVTKGGKKLSFRAIVVVGDENGKVGVGVAKADDVVNAFKKAKTDGRKNLIELPITKALSIPHNVAGNFGACKVIMRPSIEGSGVIAGGAVRIVLEVAGVKNVIAKQLGSNNLLNNARASVCALQNLTTKAQVAKKKKFRLDIIQQISIKNKIVKVNKEIRDIILKRLLVTLGVLLLIRVGTFLPVPGINHSDLAFYIQSHSVTKSLVSTFSGDDTFVIGLFTLNIFPYINASILVQLILGFSPKLSKLQKEGDLEGRRSINRLTRLITLMFALIQSVSLALYLKQILFNWNYSLAIEIGLWLTTGAMIVLWLSELITDYGLGNGASLLIYTNIISSLPNLSKTILSENSQNFTLGSEIGIVLLIFTSLYGIVFLQEGVRIIPLISSKQLNQSSLQDSVTSNNYIPLRFNQAGVMPIILTTTILVVPNYVNNLGLLPKIDLPINFESLNFVYWIGYFVLILVFSSFYSTIVLNPKDISDQLQKMAVTIPGIRPGIQTTFYLKQVMKRITLLGATMLATLATIPNFVESTLSITSLNGLSTTSLLILAGVVLDLVREVKNIYYSNVYNNMYQ